MIRRHTSSLEVILCLNGKKKKLEKCDIVEVVVINIIIGKVMNN